MSIHNSQLLEVTSTKASSAISVRQRLNLQPHWAPIYGKYKPKERIGKGAQGEVIRAKNRKTGKTVAIKYVEVQHSQISILRAIREIQILKQLSRMPNNQHTVRLLDLIVPNF